MHFRGVLQSRCAWISIWQLARRFCPTRSGFGMQLFSLMWRPSVRLEDVRAGALEPLLAGVSTYKSNRHSVCYLLPSVAPGSRLHPTPRGCCGCGGHVRGSAWFCSLACSAAGFLEAEDAAARGAEAGAGRKRRKMAVPERSFVV